MATVGDAVDAGSDDVTALEYARETNRAILSEDADFRGADPELRDTDHPGVLACDTTASPGEIAAAVRRIETFSDSISNSVWYVPGDWV